MQELGEDALHREVAQSFAKALRRAMRVAGRDDEGNLHNLSQTTLAKKAKVSRAKLTRFISPKEDEPGNPDLRTICALAKELGVPPALLLLRPEDWQTLGVAVAQFAAYNGHANFLAWEERFASRANVGPDETARAAEDLARVLSIYPETFPGDSRQVLDNAEKVSRSIINTAALAPLTELRADHVPELITLCAFAGITASKLQGNP